MVLVGSDPGRVLEDHRKLGDSAFVGGVRMRYQSHGQLHAEEFSCTIGVCHLRLQAVVFALVSQDEGVPSRTELQSRGYHRVNTSRRSANNAAGSEYREIRAPR